MEVSESDIDAETTNMCQPSLVPADLVFTTRHTPRTAMLVTAVVIMMVPHGGASDESLAGTAVMSCFDGYW
jgi:hypothetical protein